MVQKVWQARFRAVVPNLGSKNKIKIVHIQIRKYKLDG